MVNSTQSHSHELEPAELDEFVATHKGTVDDVLVTPTLAKHILEKYNTGNRKLRIGHANVFAKVLTRGGWQNTGESVVFAAEGILNNGQHRLEGIVRSGIAATMDIRFGIPRAAFAVTDTGSKRLAGDVLSIHGSSSPFGVAATVKLLLAYQAGLPGSYYNVTKVGNDEILAGYKAFKTVDASNELARRHLKRQGFVNAASTAFTYMALLETDEQTVVAFLSIIETGLAENEFNPARMLREKLLTDNKLAKNSRSSTVERLALYIKAWNSWRANQPVKSLRWILGERYPKMKVKF